MVKTWTDEQEKTLKKYYTKKSIEELSKLPDLKGKSYEAIRSKAQRMGLTGRMDSWDRMSGISPVSLWSPKQVKFLESEWTKKPKKEIYNNFKKQFGFKRTWASIAKKAHRLSLGPSYESIVKETIASGERPIDALLSILRKERNPITELNLMNMVESRSNESISRSRLNSLIEELINHGYDIKRIPSGSTIRYSLVRTADITSDMYYKSLGNISSNLLLTGDWHMGSKHFSESAYFQLVDDIEEYSFEDVLIVGDLIQSLGVHNLEGADINIWEATEQTKKLVEYLQMIPKDVNIHMILGNHEEKLKNKVQIGYDALSDVCYRMQAAGFNNVYYYGAVANLTMNGEYSCLMMHSSGGITYATSYRLERIFDKLIQRPNIFIIGHTHQMAHLSKPPHYELFIAGTLQRENAWLLNKGVTSQVGWWGMQGYSPEKSNVIRRTPRVY